MDYILLEEILQKMMVQEVNQFMERPLMMKILIEDMHVQDYYAWQIKVLIQTRLFFMLH